MTALPFGLGAIESPPDERDWDIDALYAMAGLEPLDALPTSYRIPPPYPPVLNQGNTPMCVAFSHSTLKAYQDLRDTGPVNLDELAFFRAIGGTQDGAIVRVALAELLRDGYPAVMVGQASLHRIAAYYAVPVSKTAIQSAISLFGPLVLSTRWPWSWFEPSASGVLPRPSAVPGGHAIIADGWDSRGLSLWNSWGTGYGQGGHVWMPWSYLGQVREAWKAVDRISTPPPTIRYQLVIAPRTWTLKLARLSGSCIAGWDLRRWSGVASTASCEAPVVKRGCLSGQATVARVTTGVLRGRWIRVGNGVTVKRT